MARLARTALRGIAGSSNLIGGPWFSQNGDQPVEELPTVDKAHTSYREELAVSGILIGSVIGAVTVYRFGASADSANNFMAYLGASTFGAMIFWWLGIGTSWAAPVHQGLADASHPSPKVGGRT